MAWIESHTVLVRHRKTMELAIRLKLKPVYAMGHLHAFWHTVLEQQEDGDLSRWSDQLIAQSAQWEGDATEFVTHLRELGFIDDHLVHDWIDYVGPYLTKKYSTGNPARLKEIWAKHGYKYGKGNGKFAKQKVSGKRAGSEPKSAIPFPSLPNPSSPNPSLPNQTLPEEQEARFEDEFWKPYPDRNGKKVEKAAAKLLFLSLSTEDQQLACKAVTHYAESLKQQGLSAKDPKRFLKDGKGLEPWRDWIEPAKPTPVAPRLPPPQTKCAWANSPCEEYAAPGSRYCPDHKEKLTALIAKVSRNPSVVGEVVKINVAGLTEKIGRSM